MALEFDSRFYLQTNPDVAAAISRGLIASAEDHYNQFGRFEARNPNAYFNTSFYLSTYPDVARAGVNPLTHFLTFGVNENRISSNAAANVIDTDGNGFANKFNAQAYLDANPDVKAAGVGAYKHFIEFGQFEGRTAVLTNGTVITGPLGMTGTAFALTLNQDTLNGTSGNDTFTANGLTIAAGTLANSLSSADTINGGAGVDTLKFTNVESGATVAPTLTSVENVEVRFAAAGELGLSFATGVQSVSVVNSAAAGTVSGLGAVANLTVSGTGGTKATFTDGTATALNVTASNFGSTSTTTPVPGEVVIDNALASLTLNATNSNVLVTNSGSDANFKAATVNASGTNTVDIANNNVIETLTVVGAGSVAFNSTNSFEGLKTLTAGSATGNLTGLSVDDSATSVTLGSGNDSITYSAAAAATAVIALGAGDDRINFAAAPSAGATIDGGAGNDTIGFTGAGYTTVTGYSDVNLAKITGFETLAITDVLADAASINVSKLSGITSFAAEDGVTASKAATVTGLTSGSTVTLGGNIVTNNGALTATVTNASTGTSDALTLRINGTETSSAADATVKFSASGVETLNVVASGTVDTTVSKYTLSLTNDALTTLNVSGNDVLSFTSGVSQTKLTTINASANTAGVVIDVSASVAASPTINITGTSKADTFVLANDAIVTGNGGDDTFQIGLTSSGQTYSTITDANKGDIISFTSAVDSFSSAKISLAGTAVFQDYLDAASAGTTTTGTVSWFQFSGDTFVVADYSAETTFQNGGDTVVKLTGLLDLSTASFSNAADSITIA